MSRIGPYLRLLRAPAVPTAASNILMGYLVTNGNWAPGFPLVVLLLSSIAFYAAGMVLNDVADVEEDRRLRPFRPIPSGEIPMASALRLGWILLIVGVSLSIVATCVATRVNAVGPKLLSGTIGACLGLAVVAYTFWLKRFPIGTIVLGLCRLLNVLLGMSIGFLVAGSNRLLGFTPLQWSIAGGVGAYVVGLSVLARHEADSVRRKQIAIALVLMTIAVAWLASLPWWLADRRFLGLSFDKKFMTTCLFALIFTPVFLRSVAAFTSRSATQVQRAVTSCLFSLIFIDATLCASVESTRLGFAMAVALLIVPSWCLSRWTYTT